MILRCLVPFAIACSAVAGDLPADFQQTLAQTKGPFGQNILQGTTERISVTAGRVPVGYLFQAAYRNDLARGLIANHGFYIGNLFTTNFYELMGEYVYGNPYGSFPLDHAALAARGSMAVGKATAMLRHWVLEKHYVELRPTSKLARSFKIRGISSFENELTFAKHFFNFYLGAMEDEFQYLPAFQLATKSPIFDAASLAKAREMIAVAYEEVSLVLGTDAPLVRALWKIRNSIHNQLTPAVIGEIDAFLKTFPEYRNVPPPPPQAPGAAPGEFFAPIPDHDVVASTNRRDLDEIRAILVDYYSFSAQKLVERARKLGQKDIRAAAESIIRNGVSVDGLQKLSGIAAAKRIQLSNGEIPYERRAEVLALLASTSLYVRKELSGLSNVRSPKAADTALDAMYIEGFLIRDNWLYFKNELSRGGDLSRTLSDAVEVASTGSIEEAFGPALTQWKGLERKMGNFVDDVLKSSAVDTASLLVRRLKP